MSNVIPFTGLSGTNVQPNPLGGIDMEDKMPCEGARLRWTGETKLTVEDEQPVKSLVLEEAARELDMKLEFERPNISLPFSWGDNDGLTGPAVEDPMLIDIIIPLGDNGDHPAWRLSLREVIVQMGKDFNGTFHGATEEIEILKGFKKGFADCIADLDAAIAKLQGYQGDSK